MARSIDQSKLERIKLATMELLVEKGYGGASISEIAKRADVAEGYLYRYYSSKYELVNDLLYSNINEILVQFEELLSTSSSIKTVIEKLVTRFFDMAINNPLIIKFLYVLMSDYSFSISTEQRKKIIELCRMANEKGQQVNEIRSDIQADEIYLITVIYPIQFINLRFKKYFDDNILSRNDLERVINTCIKALS